MIKKIFFLLVLIIFAASGCTPEEKGTELYETISKKDKIIVGISYDAKPFSFKDSDGQIKGMEVDLAKEIARRLLGSPNKIVFKNVTSQDRLKAVMSGDVDIVMSTMTITPQRQELVAFSEPYFIAGQAICVGKDSKIESIDDLLNKRVIVILGTTGEENIKRFAPNALIRGYINNSEAIEAFKIGMGDAITTDDSLLQGLVIDHGNYVILPTRLTTEPYGIAFKKSKLTESFRNKINEIIEEIQIDGTMDIIKNKWGIS